MYMKYYHKIKQTKYTLKISAKKLKNKENLDKKWKIL
jgi:hypothetical protein